MGRSQKYSQYLNIDLDLRPPLQPAAENAPRYTATNSLIPTIQQNALREAPVGLSQDQNQSKDLKNSLLSAIEQNNQNDWYRNHRGASYRSPAQSDSFGTVQTRQVQTGALHHNKQSQVDHPNKPQLTLRDSIPTQFQGQPVTNGRPSLGLNLRRTLD